MMLTKMLATCGAAIAVVACAERQPVGTTMVTSGVVSRDTLAVVEQQRDMLQAQLGHERTARQAAEQRNVADTKLREEHDKLELAIIDALERAARETQALREQKSKQATDQLEEAKAFKTKLYGDMRRLHGDMGGKTFDAFRVEVESTIADLDRAIAMAREKAQKK